MPRTGLRLPILTGATASGKTQLGLAIARELGCEIINADSMLVYRGMDLGTAKPTSQEREEIRHHLIDIRDPSDAFTAGDFVREVNQAASEIASRGKRALVVGGTGFYLKALVFGLWDAPKARPEIRAKLELLSNSDLYRKLEALDAKSALRITPGDRYRLIRALEIIESTGKTPSELEREREAAPPPAGKFETWILERDSETLNRRITLRAKEMLSSGLIEEVTRIRNAYPGCRALSAVGYAQVCAYLDGIAPAGRKLKPGLAGLQEEIELATRQLVKQQRTWFRAFGERTQARRIHPKEGMEQAIAQEIRLFHEQGEAQ